MQAWKSVKSPKRRGRIKFEFNTGTAILPDGSLFPNGIPVLNGDLVLEHGTGLLTRKIKLIVFGSPLEQPPLLQDCLRLECELLDISTQTFSKEKSMRFEFGVRPVRQRKFGKTFMCGFLGKILIYGLITISTLMSQRRPNLPIGVCTQIW